MQFGVGLLCGFRVSNLGDKVANPDSFLTQEFQSLPPVSQLTSVMSNK